MTVLFLKDIWMFLVLLFIKFRIYGLVLFMLRNVTKKIPKFVYINVSFVFSLNETGLATELGLILIKCIMT